MKNRILCYCAYSIYARVIVNLICDVVYREYPGRLLLDARNEC